MRAKHLFYMAAAALAAALAPPPAQARTIKIYTFNGPSRKPPTPVDTIVVADTVAVAGYPDLKLGSLTWASANVDDFRTFAAKPDMYAKFYQFNRTKAWATTGSVSGWVSGIVESSDWLPDSSPCPAGWRLPTQAEYAALYHAGSTWAGANERGNAVAGRFFGGKHATCELPKSMDGCAFFPAEGYRHYTNGTIDTQAAALHAWSGTQVDAVYGYNLGFNSTKGDPANNAYKAYGLSVRCVRNAP